MRTLSMPVGLTVVVVEGGLPRGQVLAVGGSSLGLGGATGQTRGDGAAPPTCCRAQTTADYTPITRWYQYISRLSAAMVSMGMPQQYQPKGHQKIIVDHL